MKKFLRALLGFAWSAALAAPGFASSEEGGSSSPETSQLGWTFRILNFVILFGGLGYLLRGAPAFFRERAERIVGAITEARRVKDEADRQLQTAQSKLVRLDQEVAELRADAVQDGVAEAERIRALAREEAAKIQRAALLEIEAAERAARMELKAAAARLAVERAEAIVKGRMTPEAQAALVRAFVENLGRAN